MMVLVAEYEAIYRWSWCGALGVHVVLLVDLNDRGPRADQLIPAALAPADRQGRAY